MAHATKRSPITTHADRSTVSLTPEGARVATLDVLTEVTQDARALSLLAGRDVLITAGESKTYGYVVSVTLTPDKKQPGTIHAKAKLTGLGELERLVGRPVDLEKAQTELLGTNDEE